MDSNKLVWYPDTQHGYCIGRIVDISQSKVSVQPISVASQIGNKLELFDDRLNSQQSLEFPYKSVFPCDQYDINFLNKKQNFDNIKDVDDNCALIHLNEAALLENIRLRFQRDKIYTYTAHILIAVNPYFEIKNLHSPEAIEKYQGKSLGTLPPHVYAIADKAYRDMRAFKQSQSIIINGESGAGRLEKLILDANPLLEAFGNAKTIRNNNSSRFGKFIEVHYNSNLTVSGGLFYHYLLEKSRICTQSAGERNYHIFYQLCSCLPSELWKKLELNSPDKFHYMANGCTQYFCSKEFDSKKLDKSRKSPIHLKLGAIQDQLIDDIKCYEQTDKALSNFGVSEKEKFDIYSIVAALLHLGNISFCDDSDDNRGGCRIDTSNKISRASLETTARLMGLEKELLEQSLVSRIMSTARGGHKGTVYMVQLSAQQAQAARDALAKAIYSKLFDYIVTKIINKSIPSNPEQSSHYIGVLDVAGFEYFQHNSFEQFLINFCNEKLQQFFNELILKEEQAIYDKEGLNLKKVEFTDNQDCIQLFETKSIGIFDLLDEESRLPKPSAQHFTQSVHSNNKKHFRLAVPRTSKLKVHRELRDDEGFLIRHFAGAVCYETNSFIDKNNDALHASLKNLMLEADHNLLRDLFIDNSTDNSHGSHQQQSNVLIQQQSTTLIGNQNKLNFVSVASTFRSQLNQLMGKLRSTGSHFIRCIKPNSEMVAHKFEGGQILSQLHCSGMDSVLELMQQGYPSRSSFNSLYESYRGFLPAELARLDSHLFCRALFKVVGLNESDFKFGSSKVFFRPSKFAEFDQIIKSNSEHVAELVKKVSKWLIRARWRKAQYCCLSVVKLRRKICYRRELIIRVQKYWRMVLVRSRLQYRISSINLARTIEKSLLEFERLTGQQLKKAPDREMLEEQSSLLRTEIELFLKQQRSQVAQCLIDTDVSPKTLAQMKAICQADLDKLVTKRDLLIRSIKDRLAKEKEMQELERKMVEENKRRQEEELAKRREDEIKQQRFELERRRQQELLVKEKQQVEVEKSNGNEERKIQINFDRNNHLKGDAEDEQEQRDYEIALRLAQENLRGQLKQQKQLDQQIIRQPLPPSANHANSANSNLNYDLSKWKYSDLRDTINTSCDLELLEACKREFHRRLKVYHAWRAMNNSRQSTIEPDLRAPTSVMNNSSSNSLNSDHSSLTSNTTSELLNTKKANFNRANEQRYFRIPFVKNSNAKGQRGWWFAHFDGQWIARQLEIHPDRQPILLIAGQHDIEMCELSLKETRLTAKRGAEILPQEFEEEWQKHGGKPYNHLADSTTSKLDVNSNTNPSSIPSKAIK